MKHRGQFWCLISLLLQYTSDKKVLNYKDYINPRPVAPQRLGLNAHGIYTDDVYVLVYETARVVEEVYPRRDTFVMAYRRLMYPSGARGPEDKEVIHVRDIKKMTACTNEGILDENGITPDVDSSPDEHESKFPICDWQCA